MYPTICALSGKRIAFCKDSGVFNCRLCSLFRYGGTHLDLDFIMKKSISNLEPNYACAETNKSINNALLNSDHRGTGHEIIKLFLQ